MKLETRSFLEANWNEDLDRQDIDENENMEIENDQTNKTEESILNEEWAEDCEEEDNRGKDHAKLHQAVQVGDNYRFASEASFYLQLVLSFLTDMNRGISIRFLGCM